MRGKAGLYCLKSSDFGITPAHAGKSECRACNFVRRRDHPRTCGEKCFTLPPDVVEMGSPPHMRGKDANIDKKERMIGITPAHAGKSKVNFAPFVHPWDHPRTCGEKTQEVTKYKAYDILHA